MVDVNYAGVVNTLSGKMKTWTEEKEDGMNDPEIT